jgi:hypothetical protein
MKYMLVMRATDEVFAGMADIDFNEMLETIGKYNEEMIRAGVLVAAEGLDGAAEGVVVDYSCEPPVVTDGPYGVTPWFSTACSRSRWRVVANTIAPRSAATAAAA